MSQIVQPEFPPEGEISVTWKQFQERVSQLREVHAARRLSAPLLFRGHANANWKLETTLERRQGADPRLLNYYIAVGNIKSQIEAYTKERWSKDEFSSVFDTLANFDNFSTALANNRFPAQEYLIYLRHHGFPSPLLDWTRSPYIAAFFAFRLRPSPPCAETVIYCFQDAACSSKRISRSEPTIWRLGVSDPCHPRHFLQQADYTVCLTDQFSRFGNHEQVLAEPVNPPTYGGRPLAREYRLWKFRIPWDESSTVADALADCNLSAFSLFQTEDSLMESLSGILSRF